MEIPEWLMFWNKLDEEIIYHPAFWMFLLGGWVAFALGFKFQNSGILGATTAASIGMPGYTQFITLAAWPFVVYIFMWWKLK